VVGAASGRDLPPRRERGRTHIYDRQRLPPPLILTDDAEVSRRQEVIMAPDRQFRLAAHHGTYLELTLHTGFTLVTFDIQLTDAVRQVGGRAYA
jgi:hypothetical protein